MLKTYFVSLKEVAPSNRVEALDDGQACILLGGVSEDDFSNWKSGKVSQLSIDTRARLSLMSAVMPRPPKRGLQWLSSAGHKRHVRRINHSQGRAGPIASPLLVWLLSCRTPL